MLDSRCINLDFAVIIPYYNNLNGLVVSLNSIRYDTTKFQVVIVDDGSDETLTKNILSGLLTDTLEFNIINLSFNKGITHALNEGLKWIQNNVQVTYIARLDCGDVCHEDRFLKQVAYLDSHSDVHLIGSWCKFKSKDGKIEYSYTTPTRHEEIVNEMHCRNTFIHPSVMFRSSVVNSIGYYPYEYPHVEDYAYFWRIIKQYKSAILGELLLTCEINPNGISMKNRREQLSGRWKVVDEFADSLFFKILGGLRLLTLRYIPTKLLMSLK